MRRAIKLLSGLTIAFVCIATCHSACPQHTFDTARTKACSDVRCLGGLIVRGCIGPDTVLDNTRTLNIWGNTSVWRRGAIHDLPDLVRISAFNNGIFRLNPGVFLNLPKLKQIDLVYGNIEEIQWGVFSNSTLVQVNLRYNLISYVEDEAFSDMPNLKYLYLSHNNLKEIQQNWFKNSYGITSLDFQYNNIEKIHPFTFSVFPDLRYLDLSFNQIKEFGDGSLENVKGLNFLDLTHNRLSWIPTNVFTAETLVKELRLSLNHLSFLSTMVLSNGNVKSLSLHPNPWQCPCLNEVLKWMQDHNATLINPGDDWRIIYDSTLPECVVNSKSPNECVIGYDDAFLKTQEIFFREVNYTNAVRAKPTSVRPDFYTIPTAPPFLAHLSPLN